ncbi:MAG: recombinase family protein, partial [Allobaculum sp.]|nr:recombinase family protein [Allobaculum sp.]
IPTSKNLEKWGKAHVRYILDNEKYTGDSVYQKNYTTDTVPFRTKKNYGQLPMYYVSGTHEGIISKEIFEKAQALTAARKQAIPYTKMQYYPLTKK